LDWALETVANRSKGYDFVGGDYWELAGLSAGLEEKLSALRKITVLIPVKELWVDDNHWIDFRVGELIVQDITYGSLVLSSPDWYLGSITFDFVKEFQKLVFLKI
jgi:hypothetical protein